MTARKRYEGDAGASVVVVAVSSSVIGEEVRSTTWGFRGFYGWRDTEHLFSICECPLLPGKAPPASTPSLGAGCRPATSSLVSPPTGRTARRRARRLRCQPPS